MRTMWIAALLAVASACGTPAGGTDGGSGVDAAGTDAPGTDAASIDDAGSSIRLGACTALPTETCSSDGWCSSRAFLSSAYSVHAVAVDDVWLGLRGGVVHFDGSQVCPLQPWPDAGRVFGIHGTATDDLWIVGDDSMIVHWDGSEARVYMGPVTSGGIHWSGVWAASRTDVWAVGDRSIAHWDGTNWTMMDGPGVTRGSFEDVRGVDAGHVWAVVGDNTGTTPFGQILEWNGTAWSSAYTDDTVWLRAVEPASATEVYVSGSTSGGPTGVGRVFAGPGTWTEVPAGTWSVQINDTVVRPGGELRVLGDNGNVFTRTTGGWAQEVSGLENATDPTAGPDLYQGSAAGNVVYVAAKDGYFLRRTF